MSSIISKQLFQTLSKDLVILVIQNLYNKLRIFQPDPHHTLKIYPQKTYAGQRISNVFLEKKTFYFSIFSPCVFQHKIRLQKPVPIIIHVMKPLSVKDFKNT